MFQAPHWHFMTSLNCNNPAFLPSLYKRKNRRKEGKKERKQEKERKRKEKMYLDEDTASKTLH